MTYEEFRLRRSFDADDLLAFARGDLPTQGPAAFRSRLPLPPMLMIDRIVDIERKGSRGRIVAERSVSRDDWYFACHFAGDPVQPGCLGVDGVWQLLGFFCAWSGALGAGRALGCGEIEFRGQILPHHRLVRYTVEVRRLALFADSAIAIGDATVEVDGEVVYTLARAKAGVFPSLAAGGSEAVAHDAAVSR